MIRLFSVRRRRPHIVDMVIPRSSDPAIDGYRVEAAVNFDDAFTTIIDYTEINNIGYVDPAVNRNVLDTQPVNNSLRVVFDPDTYNGTAGIADVSSFWLRVVHLDGGVVQVTGAPTLVLPDATHHALITQVIAGTAPTSELQLDLPLLMENVNIVNTDAAVNLLVGTEEGGPKHVVLPLNDQYLGFNGAVGSMYVQGDGATVDFTANFTLCFPR